MTHPVISVTPGTSFAEAICLMFQHKVSGLPVVAEQDRLVGMIT